MGSVLVITQVCAARDGDFLLLEKFLGSCGAGMVVPLFPQAAGWDEEFVFTGGG